MSLFRVPKFTEYALRSLTCLARNEQRMTVHEIAACEHIHPASLAKILHMLSWQGLVHSKRGRQGGFWLAREPARIRLQQVVEIFQGPFDVEAEPGDAGFPAAWERLCAPTRHALEKMTLADLLRSQLGADKPCRARQLAPGRARPRDYASRERA